MSDQLPPPEDEDDILAAEYVIGLVAPEDRAALARRAANDPGFARAVADWRRRLAALDDAYGDIAPPDRVKAAIDARLFGSTKPRMGWLERSLRWATAGAVVAGLAVALFFETDRVNRLDGVLTADGSGYRFAVAGSRLTNVITVDLAEGETLTDATFELWLIPDSGIPVSLGTFSPSDEIVVGEGVRLAPGSLLAVSIEPPGGSPTGQPTGPVVAVGPVG